MIYIASTAHSHKMETSQMETIPYMETFLIYQTAYYIKQGGFGNFFSVKSLKWKQFPMKIIYFFSFSSFSNHNHQKYQPINYFLTKIKFEFEILTKISA